MFDLIAMLNDKTMYGYNDWKIANISEFSEILDERRNDIKDGVKQSNRSVRTTIYDEKDIEYFYSHYRTRAFEELPLSFNSEINFRVRSFSSWMLSLSIALIMLTKQAGPIRYEPRDIENSSCVTLIS